MAGPAPVSKKALAALAALSRNRGELDARALELLLKTLVPTATPRP